MRVSREGSTWIMKFNMQSEKRSTWITMHKYTNGFFKKINSPGKLVSLNLKLKLLPATTELHECFLQ